MMNTVFILASGLLVLSGLLHLGKVILAGFDPQAFLPALVTAVFGLAYLVIGTFLYHKNERALLAGVVVPLIGGLLALIGMAAEPSPLTISFILIDAVVVLCCLYLLRASRPTLHRID